MNIIKKLIALLILVASFASFAGEKLVLMTSLDPIKNRPVGRSKVWNINQKLENIFFDKLRREITNLDDVKIIHFATVQDLERELADPENKAVFWVSHSNGSDAGSVLDRNVIVDYEGKDLSEAFQNPSNKLEYLAFVGCRADYTVKKHTDMGVMNNNENLQVYSSQKKVDARRALKRAISNYRYHLYQGNLSESTKSCETVERQKLIIRRTLPMEKIEEHKITAIKVLQRGRLLGVFPIAELGDVQELAVAMVPGESKRDIKLVFDSGIASEQVVMGEFEVLGQDYQVFSTRDGRPLGKGRYVFNFKGDLLELPNTEIITKKNCIN